MADYTYKISLDEENHIVHLVVKGDLNKNEGEKVISEARALADETQSDILCDVSRANIKVSLAEWFYLARNKEIYPTTPTEKTALVIKPEDWKLYQFVENVTLNKGIKLRAFLNEEDARAWLKKA
jgi:hypothetical protein